MGVQVRIGSGTGFETLLVAVAVADADWRDVFTHGETALDAVRRAGGAALVRDVRRVGRYGWIALAGLLADQRLPWDHATLVGAVRDTSPADLHLLLVGGRRRQLLDLVDEATLRSAVSGSGSAQAVLRRALRSGSTLLTVSPWLMAGPSADVHAATVRMLDALTGLDLPAPDVRPLRARLRQVGDAAVVDEVAAGVHYADRTLDRVLLVSSVQVTPILVTVDEPERTIVIHPPYGSDGAADASTHLRELGRAVGDPTRIRLMQELRGGPRTLLDLGQSLDSPRTTLLHHLAMLRSAGLVDLAVSTPQPNVYTLRPEGFEHFGRVVRGFVEPYR